MTTTINGPAQSGNAETNPPPDSGFNLTTTDNVTIQGDGSDVNPVKIKAVQHDGTLTGNGTVASPLSAPVAAKTTEHINVAVSPGAVVAAKDVSFVSWTGLAPEAPTGVSIVLPNGTVDGQQHEIMLAKSNNITWSIAPTTFLDGANIGFVTSLAGGALFVWDGTAAGWRLAASQGGTVA